MGRITDWEKVFENLEYLFYEAFLKENKTSFSERFLVREEYAETLNEIVPRASAGQSSALFHGYKYLDTAWCEEKHEKEIYSDRNLPEKVLKKDKDEDFYDFLKKEEEINNIWEKIEKTERNINYLTKEAERVNEYKIKTEKVVFEEESSEKIKSLKKGDSLADYEASREMIEGLLVSYHDEIKNSINISEEYQPKKSGMRKILETGQQKAQREKRDIKIEMHNVNNVTNDTDIDRITDMLTGRLCEIMQKSAEGIYM